MIRKASRLLLFIAVCTASGCGESDLVDVPEQGDVALQAVTAMLTPLFAGALTIPAEPAPAGGPQPAPYGYDSPISVTQPCSESGQVMLVGTALVLGDDETNEVSVQRSTTLEFQACATRTDGVTVTIGSSPSIIGALAFSVLFVDEEPTFLQGGLTNNPTITAPGFQQECNVMVDFQSTTITANSVTLEILEGSACGQDLTGEMFTVPL